MKTEEYNKAFSDIAQYYDTLMSYVNYPAWVAYIERLLKYCNISKKTILDLACGTGVCLEIWRHRGYRVIGLDKSFAMLKICKSRFPDDTTDVAVVNGDMCGFAFTEKVPIITCLYDSLNYLLSEEALAMCFKNVYDALDAGGVFFFDMNTVHCLQNEWGNGTFHRQDKEIHSVWSNTFDSSTNISTLKLTLMVQKNGNVEMIRESHQERGYSLMTIAELLETAGFEYSFYKHLTFNPAHERDMRIMGVASK
jgi:SAM-dependent methyltransferase